MTSNTRNSVFCAEHLERRLLMARDVATVGIVRAPGDVEVVLPPPIMLVDPDAVLGPQSCHIVDEGEVYRITSNDGETDLSSHQRSGDFQSFSANTDWVIAREWRGSNTNSNFLAANVDSGECVDLGVVGTNHEFMWADVGDEFWYIDPTNNDRMTRRAVRAPEADLRQVDLPTTLPAPSSLGDFEVNPTWLAGSASGEGVQYLVGYYKHDQVDYEVPTTFDGFANPDRPTVQEAQAWYEQNVQTRSYGDQIRYVSPSGRSFYFHALNLSPDETAGPPTLTAGQFDFDYYLSFDAASGEFGDGFWLVDATPNWNATGGHNVNTFNGGYHFALESCFNWHENPVCLQSQRHTAGLDGSNFQPIESSSLSWSHETGGFRSPHIVYGNSFRGSVQLRDVVTDTVMAEIGQSEIRSMLDTSTYVAYVHGDVRNGRLAWSALDYGVDHIPRTDDDMYHILFTDFSGLNLRPGAEAETEVVATFFLRTDSRRFFTNTSPSLSPDGTRITWSKTEGGGPIGRADIFVAKLGG